MTYSPINFRRLDWFKYDASRAFPWSEIFNSGHGELDPSQVALTVNAYRGGARW